VLVVDNIKQLNTRFVISYAQIKTDF